jgi:hypothetical protein
MCLATWPTPKWHFVSGVSKFPKLGLMRLWGPIILCEDLRLRCGLKQSCSLWWELSNSMSHATCTQGNRGNSWLLVVGSQIANLTPDLSFGHNLYLKCPNESCELTLDIYVPRAFQWYKKHFNPMGFDPCNISLKIWESIGSPTPKIGTHLGVWVFIPSHSPTLLKACNVTSGLRTWPTPLQALALVASPSLGL